EEAVTTLMTNLAPWFGVPLGSIYITASSNYWDVILGHSLVIIAPAFAAWAWLLGRYEFRPVQVLLLFGLTGLLLEARHGGASQFMQSAMWILVYGLMVYAPAWIVPKGALRITPRWKHYVLAVFLPILFMPMGLPVRWVVTAVRPSAGTEFPPIVLP